MKHSKRLIPMTLAAALLMSGGTVSYAETAPSADNDGCMTLSVEEFTELAEQHGAVVMRESDYHPVTRMQDYFAVELTNNNWKEVGTDINLLNENVRVTVITLTDNIDSVDIKFFERHSNETYTETSLKEGDITDIFEVTATHGYTVKVKANSDPKLSSTNKGVVTLYWSDAY